RGRGGRDEQHRRDHDGLHLVPEQTAGRGADHAQPVAGPAPALVVGPRRPARTRRRQRGRGRRAHARAHAPAPIRAGAVAPSATWPSTILIVRAACLAARAGSWVTRTSVCPAAFSSVSRRPISWPVA